MKQIKAMKPMKKTSLGENILAASCLQAVAPAGKACRAARGAAGTGRGRLEMSDQGRRLVFRNRSLISSRPRPVPRRDGLSAGFFMCFTTFTYFMS
jgi:hypothetical protein